MTPPRSKSRRERAGFDVMRLERIAHVVLSDASDLTPIVAAATAIEHHTASLDWRDPKTGPERYAFSLPDDIAPIRFSLTVEREPS